MTNEIQVASLQALTDCLSRAQFTCLVRSESGMTTIEYAAIALAANVLAKARVFSEAESILVFDKLRPQFVAHRRDFRLAVQQAAGTMFQMIVANPWSNSACATCTGYNGFIQVADGAAVSRQGTVFVSVSVNVSALLISVWERLMQRPANHPTETRTKALSKR